VDFATAVDAVERLVGVEVSASFWGLGKDPSLMGSLQGKLKSRHDVQSEDDLPLHVREAIGGAERAVTFAIGDHWGNDVTLWPSRFVSAEPTEGPDGVAITTLDGVIIVQSNRPWID
jgi:hypothetical protein